MPSKTLLHSGSESARPLELRAGPLSLLFEPDTAFLRRLRLGDHEVLRAIYGAVRDQQWSTIKPQVTNLKSEVRPDSFRLTFDVNCRGAGVEYAWQGVITGETNGRIRYSFDGTAHSDFLRNRIGVCILHPITECAGQSLTIEHTDGRKEQGRFPALISPYQPFEDIRTISYDVSNTGISALLETEGDVFEMEDQRNWTDASFKTYCTPLARPLPHPVRKGDRVQQAATLSLSGNVRPILPVNVGRAPQLSIQTTPVFTLPPLGLCVASHGRPLTTREASRVKALQLSHLRVDLRLEDPGCAAKLEQADSESRMAGCGLHIALVLGEQTETFLPKFVQLLDRLKPRVLLWIVLHESENPTSEKTVNRVRVSLQKVASNVLFAAGTRDFFTEINRVRLSPGAASSLCYSNNPQVHAFDNTTLVENLAGQVYNVESARAFTPRPVVISPITLRIRNNASAAAEQSGALAALPSDVDPRQLSLLGAGWTVASIARLAVTGFVHSLTYFETTGWRGLMEGETGSPLPKLFPSEPGMVFPVYHIFADIAEWSGRQVHATTSTHPLLADGLTLVDAAGRRRILAANLTGDAQELKIKTGTGPARVRYLDETTADQAMRRPEDFRQQAGPLQESVSGKIELKLLPFAVARIDIG